jgi:hypothetical protein
LRSALVDIETPDEYRSSARRSTCPGKWAHSRKPTISGGYAVVDGTTLSTLTVVVASGDKYQTLECPTWTLGSLSKCLRMIRRRGGRNR